MFEKLKRIISWLNRKLFTPNKSYLACNKPISNKFGCDRGTPIDRYYIEKFLVTNKVHIKDTVLEISDNYYCKKFGNGVVKYEVLHATSGNNKATIIGDLTNPESLPENMINCFVCTQTFNFIYDVKRAIEGSYRVLDNNGVLLATVAGISQISRYDMERWGDYWRFTDKSIKLMFEEVFGVGNVEITIFGNVLAGVTFLQGIAVEELPKPELLEELDSDYQLIIGIKAIKRNRSNTFDRICELR